MVLIIFDHLVGKNRVKHKLISDYYYSTHTHILTPVKTTICSHYDIEHTRFFVFNFSYQQHFFFCVCVGCSSKSRKQKPRKPKRRNQMTEKKLSRKQKPRKQKPRKKIIPKKNYPENKNPEKKLPRKQKPRKQKRRKWLVPLNFKA